MQNIQLAKEHVAHVDMGDIVPSCARKIPHGVTPHLFYTHSRTLDAADERPYST